MKSEIKNLLKAMLDYVDNPREKNILLKKAEEKISKEVLFVLIRDILDWNNPFFIKIYDLNPNQMKLITDERNFKYKEKIEYLLELCPILKELFHIKADTLLFNDKVNNTEINEIRNYIQTNKVINIESKETRMRK
jgi:hypothetical protein